MSKVSDMTDEKLAKPETCDFVKLKYSKSQLVTKTVDMPQFGVDFEPLFMFEVLLSPDRLQSKRSTLNMVQLIQAFGAFRGALTLIGL